METKKSPFDLHFFVCTNVREGKASCGAAGGAELRENLKKASKGQVPGKIRVNAAGCLGFCDDGICAVAYPQGKLYTHLKKDDVDHLVHELQNLVKP